MSKKICITGGAGFIAHHAIETILDAPTHQQNRER